jgi:hypothetical protein
MRTLETPGGPAIACARGGCRAIGVFMPSRSFARSFSVIKKLERPLRNPDRSARSVARVSCGDRRSRQFTRASGTTIVEHPSTGAGPFSTKIFGQARQELIAKPNHKRGGRMRAKTKSALVKNKNRRAGEVRETSSALRRGEIAGHPRQPFKVAIGNSSAGRSPG